MISEAQKKASAKYDAANTVQVHLKLNKVTDADIIELLNSTKEGKQSLIKRLLREYNSKA
jgi:hypothetical protein